MSRAAFFRQSGWMMFATLVSGVCMFGVHPFSKLVSDAEYGVFVTMISMLNCLAIPSIGLQMVFAQQTAAALTPEQRLELSGTTRGVLWGTGLVWLVMVILVGVFHGVILERWKINSSSILWLTLLVGLGVAWKPVFGGILQGQQNFLWFGWSSILEGSGRLVGVAVMVGLLWTDAVGMMTGVLIGTALGLGLFLWQSRSVWLGPSAPFLWRPWLGRVLPLTLGLGAFTFMYSADLMFVKAWFDPERTGHYGAAGTLARALVAFTGPVVWVMFPKIVRAMAVSEKTDVLWLTLVTTGVLASMGALMLSVLAPWLFQIVYKESYMTAVPMLRWFAWSMVPLTLANVLINNMMARCHFRVVPWLLAVAVLYTFLLFRFHDALLDVIRVIGFSNLLFLTVALWFTWRNETSPGKGSVC